MEEIRGQIIESSDGKIVIRAPVKDGKEWQDWLQDFQLKSNSAWIVRNTFPSCSKATFRKDYVCQHSDFNKAVHSSKRSKNTVCKAKLSVKIKPITANTRAKDKYVKGGLPAVITVSLEHNHSLETAEALYYTRPSRAVKQQFDEYFMGGMNVSEAIRAHQDYLELSEGISEKTFTSSALNPKQRTVSFWYDQWRRKHLGPREGKSACEFIKERIKVYEQNGTKVVIEEDPVLAVVIVTPMMQRAHTLPLASKIVFMDTTSSCDSENHAITFLLTPCEAGAVPLAVFITSGQRQADYETSFNLLKRSVGENLFGGQQYPKVFITDDSLAEQNAIKSTFPKSGSKLCLFHVAQAVWRWLWNSVNKVALGDRKTLMQEFQSIMRSSSVEQAELTYKEACDSPTSTKYGNWRTYLQSHWERRELWVIAWRGAEMCGNHTNNYAEITVRLYKDIVLSRCKAYNLTALVDFTCTVMEKYYVRRLRSFANSREVAPRLLLQALLKKAEYLNTDNITRVTAFTYLVPSERSDEKYEVDISVGICMCEAGKRGKFCKHQAGILKCFSLLPPNAPGVTAEARHKIAVLALGDEAEPLSFYQPLRNGGDQPSQINAVDVNDSNVRSHSDDGNIETIETEEEVPQKDNSVCESAVDEKVQSFTAKFESLHQAFGTSEVSIDKLLRRIGTVKNANQWEIFVATLGGMNAGHRANASIRVQPTTVCRRTEGVTRGSKRLASGRPAVGTKRASKRPRNLANAISHNQPNAKSHGSGH